MRKSFAASFAAGLLVFWNAAYAAPEETPDGRFGTQCAARAFGNTCMLSFYRLLATPEKYDGKLVFVSGFLIKLYGVEPMLFASRDSYNTGLPIEGIFVDAPIPPGIASHLEKGISPVWVIGTFDARFIGHDFPRLGALRNVKNITMGLPPPTGIREKGRSSF